MPFLKHFLELRDRLRNAAIAFMVAVIGCWFAAPEIYAWLREPLFHAWEVHAKTLGHPVMGFSSITEPFWVYMSVALWAGVFAASPFIFFQLWRFIAPGLYKRERRVGIWFAVFSAFFFVAGAVFCYYFVLEQLFSFLLGYASPEQMPVLMMNEYLEFTRNMMLAFGVVFELPVLIYFLAMVGLVTHRSLWKFNRYAIVLSFITGAILTPSPDVVSQLFMALPMVALYNMSIIVAYFITTKREAKQKLENGPDLGDDDDDE